MTLQEILSRHRAKRGRAARSAPPSALDLVFAGAVALCLASASGCAVGGGAKPPTANTCAQFDSSYAHSGFETPLTVTGKATVDANQYQIRGIIRAEFYPSGDIYFDFSSSVLFGSQIEDFFFSMVADTIRIVDRERGHFYQDEEALQFLRDVLGMDFDVAETLRLATGGRPPCGEIDALRARVHGGDIAFDGRYRGEHFEVVFSGPGRRLKSCEWPVIGDDGRKDWFKASYRWADAAEADLRQLVLRFDAREWRCRITATD
jgi:hypothetical protein